MCAKAQGHETTQGTQTLERFPYSGCGAISEVRWMRETCACVSAGRRLRTRFGTWTLSDHLGMGEEQSGSEL